MNIKKEFSELLNRIILITLFIFSQSVYARFLVEPSYNYTSGRFDGVEGRGSFSGNSLSINLGYLGENFMVGFTFEKGLFFYDSELTSNSHEKFDGGGIGSFIGFHVLDRFKIWTGYLNSSIEPTANNDIRYFGQQFTFGIGYRIYDGLMLNLQTFRNQFTQIEDDTTGKTTGLDINPKTQGNSIGLSYMLVF